MAELLRRQVATQELTVEAARERGPGLAVDQAFALDPLAGRGDLRDIEAMVDELLAGTARWLPQLSPTTSMTRRDAESMTAHLTTGGPRATRIHRPRSHGPAHDRATCSAAGHTVTVASRGRGRRSTRPVALGAIDGGDPAGVAAASEVVFLCVPNSPEVVEVVDALVARRSGPTTSSSTARPSTPTSSGPSTAAWRATGAGYLDAPLSGGTVGAEKGTLTLMVGGDEATLERGRARPSSRWPPWSCTWAARAWARSSSCATT